MGSTHQVIIRKEHSMKKISKIIAFFLFLLVGNLSIGHATPPGWTEDIRLTNDPGNSSVPAIATDTNGIHVVWKDYRDGNPEIYYKRSSDGGNTWTGDKRLTNDPDFSNLPAIAMDRNGIHVVWDDYRDGNHEIYYKMSSDGGNIWTGDKRLTNDAASSRRPAMATDNNGVHIVWCDKRDGNYEIYYKRSSDGGNTWIGDKRLTNDPDWSQPPVIATDSRGIHVVWEDERHGNDEIYYKRSSDGGNTWIGDVRLTNASSGSSSPAIATDGDGIHVVWCDHRDDNWEIYYKRSSDGGNTWTGDIRLTNDSAYSLIPAIATDSNGIHVVWDDNRDGNREIYYKRSSDGGNTWTGDVRLTNDSRDSYDPAIATDSRGIHVVWQDCRDGNWDIYYKRQGSPPVISDYTASPDRFSPNRDGEKDVTTISYDLYDNLPGDITVTIKIYDSQDDLKKTLVDGASKPQGANSDIWDGKDEAGNVVSDGTYTYKIDAVDQVGDSAEQKSETVVVDNTIPIVSSLSASPDPFSPNGDKERDTTTISYNLSEPSDVTIKMYDSGNVLKKTLVDGESKLQGANWDIWDGKNDAGIVVSDGAYTYEIDVVDKAGNHAEQKSSTVEVDNIQPTISSLSASPDPFSPDRDDIEDTTTIFYNLSDNLSGDITVTIEIYDSENVFKRTLINALPRSQGPNSQIWDGKDNSDVIVPDGTYAYKIDAIDEAGNSAIQQSGTVVVDCLPVVSSLSASPDPFSPDGDGENDTTTIFYNLSEESYVTIKIYDSEDNFRRTLNDGKELKEQGLNLETWDGRDKDGNIVLNGTYTYKIKAVDPGGHEGVERSGTVRVENLVTIDSTTPKDNGYLVMWPDKDKEIKITFNRHMSTSTITRENIQIIDEDEEKITGWKIIYVSSVTTMITELELDYCTEYTVKVSQDVTDILGNRLTKSESFSFITLIPGGFEGPITVKHKAGKVTIKDPSTTFPGGSKGYYINLVEKNIRPRNTRRRLICYEVDYSDNPKDIDQLDSLITISIPYLPDTENKKNLKLYFYNKEINRWELVKGSECRNLDDDNYYVTGEVKITNIEYCVRPFAMAGLIGEYSNYPNPFKAGKEETTIIYDLEEDAKVTISIYDLLGQLVRRIEIPKGTPEKGERGTNRVSWNGKNERGRVVANGGYYCVVEADTETGKHMKKVRKIMVIK